MAELFTKRAARRVLAASAAAALVGSVAVSQGASAQTASLSAVKVTVNVVGPVPSGVSGYLTAVTCNNLIGISGPTGTANAGSQTLSALFGTTGGSQDLLYGLNAANASTGLLGSNCSLKLDVQGTANLAAAGFSISYGGAVSGAPFFFGRAGASVTTPIVPVTQGTTIAITVAYPQITVKKVVVGDEPTAGFAYPMSIACSNANPGSAIAFLESTQAGFTIPTDVNAITGADLARIRARVVNGGFITGPSGNRYFDLGTFSSVNDVKDFVAGVAATAINAPITPVGSAGGFTGTFTLANNATRSFGINEFPAMNSTTQCEVTETDAQGAALGYSSTNGFITGTTTPAPALPGVLSGGVFKSALTKMNNTVTVTNSFVGDLIVSKVVTGDPKTNIAVYEISVACDKGGPKETFLLRDRQSKVYTGIAAGVNCLVTETRSDGATASYTDNSGDNTTDGRATVRLATPGCGQGTNVIGSNNCIASVIVTNSYVPPTTTAAPTTAAAAAATTAAPTTAAAATTAPPAVTAAPAPEVEAEATFTG